MDEISQWMLIVSLLAREADGLIVRPICIEVLSREEYVLIERKYNLHFDAEGPVKWTLANMSQSLGNGPVKKRSRNSRTVFRFV